MLKSKNSFFCTVVLFALHQEFQHASHTLSNAKPLHNILSQTHLPHCAINLIMEYMTLWSCSHTKTFRIRSNSIETSHKTPYATLLKNSNCFITSPATGKLTIVDTTAGTTEQQWIDIDQKAEEYIKKIQELSPTKLIITVATSEGGRSRTLIWNIPTAHNCLTIQEKGPVTILDPTTIAHQQSKNLINVWRIENNKSHFLYNITSTKENMLWIMPLESNKSCILSQKNNGEQAQESLNIFTSGKRLSTITCEDNASRFIPLSGDRIAILSATKGYFNTCNIYNTTSGARIHTINMLPFNIEAGLFTQTIPLPASQKVIFFKPGSRYRGGIDPFTALFDFQKESGCSFSREIQAVVAQSPHIFVCYTRSEIIMFDTRTAAIIHRFDRCLEKPTHQLPVDDYYFSPPRTRRIKPDSITINNSGQVQICYQEQDTLTVKTVSQKIDYIEQPAPTACNQVFTFLFNLISRR